MAGWAQVVGASWVGRLFGCLTALVVLMMAACSPISRTATLPPKPTATQTLTPTQTVVWFPATSTPAIPPTRQPTPTVDARPGLGLVILEDPFTDRSSWRTYRTAQGMVAYGKDDLTLAVAQPNALLTSLRSAPALADFYAEITASPSLCRGLDTYGLLLRADGDQNNYRLLVACDGRLRLERIRNGEVLVLQDWILSGQVPAGAPAKIRLGAWVTGSDLRIFVNDIYQFGGRDSVWTFGRIGVFARSAGDPPLTVAFSNLVVRELKAPPPTPVPSKTPTPTATRRATPGN